jgi:hypothetical protein
MALEKASFVTKNLIIKKYQVLCNGILVISIIGQKSHLRILIFVGKLFNFTRL